MSCPPPRLAVGEATANINSDEAEVSKSGVRISGVRVAMTRLQAATLRLKFAGSLLHPRLRADSEVGQIADADVLLSIASHLVVGVRQFIFSGVENSIVTATGWPQSPTGFGEHFHKGAFDRCGVLYHLSTRGNTCCWANPHATGRVTVSMSSFELSGVIIGSRVHVSGPDRFVSGPSEKPGGCCTQHEPNSWMQVDLGPSRRLVLDHYALRNDESGSLWVLRNWTLEGARAPTGRWTELRRHDDDESLPAKPNLVAHWEVTAAGGGGFRVFRVRQHGPNNRGDHKLTCGGIELYGILEDEEDLAE